MGYEIWSVCDKCGDRIPIDVNSLVAMMLFAVELAKRARSYVDIGGQPSDRVTINCPPCSAGTRGVDGEGKVVIRPGTRKGAS